MKITKSAESKIIGIFQEELYMTIKTEDFFYNASLDKMMIQDIKVGKEVYVNMRTNPYFGEVRNFTSINDGELGIVIYDKKGERHEVHPDWIFHHPAIIDRTNKFYSFAGEVILVHWGLEWEDTAICVFCQVDGVGFKLINLNSVGPFPNRMSDYNCSGRTDDNGKRWISKSELIEASEARFQDIELTGKTVMEYFNQEETKDDDLYYYYSGKEGYWSNMDGWCPDVLDATLFTKNEIDSFFKPISEDDVTVHKYPF